ncbi:hypothetical protein WP50_31190, partial [Lactiplantibacillus plantarum]
KKGMELANDIAFPIIITPGDELISETMRKMLSIILKSQTNELRRIVKANQTLADLLLKDPTNTTVLNKCSELIHHPLFLMDTLIKAMHNANCAGLGFKDHRYVYHLQKTVIE